MQLIEALPKEVHNRRADILRHTRNKAIKRSPSCVHRYPHVLKMTPRQVHGDTGEHSIHDAASGSHNNTRRPRHVTEPGELAEQPVLHRHQKHRTERVSLSELEILREASTFLPSSAKSARVRVNTEPA